MTYAFRDTAPILLARGYSPLPITPGTKRPALPAWQRACDGPLPPALIDQYARQPTQYGVGVALGYEGLVAIDLDSDDPAVIAAVRSVLEPSPVAKAGARGRTDFYTVTNGVVRSMRIAGADGMLVEVLGRGAQTVIPPTLHPTTGVPYEWLGEAPLGEVRVNDLPVLPVGISARLTEMLQPWRLRKDRSSSLVVSHHKPVGILTDFERARQHRYVTAILVRELPGFAAMRPNSGRNPALFQLVCRIGRWWHHGILPTQKMMPLLLSAAEANGLIRDDGLRSVHATIASGLRQSSGDPLPDLGSTARGGQV